jgi:hypothetical protein
MRGNELNLEGSEETSDPSIFCETNFSFEYPNLLSLNKKDTHDNEIKLMIKGAEI